MVDFIIITIIIACLICIFSYHSYKKKHGKSSGCGCGCDSCGITSCASNKEKE